MTAAPAMLYLKSPADSAADDPQRGVPLVEQSALRLERALLTSDPVARQRELAEALADDRDFAGWMLRAAELRLSRTINRTEEAVTWLGQCLEMELAVSLVSDDQSAAAHPTDITWRLPALVTKMHGYERRLADFDARLEQEKLASLKELAYGASHEINNPLANIAARAQTLVDDETDPERVRKLTAIHRQAMRAHEMIADLMLFARPPKQRPSHFDLRHLVRQIVDELGDLCGEYEVQLAFEADEQTLELLADETQLAVAIQAVVVNALEAASGGGHVTVSLRRATTNDGARAEITVRDDGPGISDQTRQHVFDPFFSGREAGRGLGFGLSKCWRIVTDHGGQVLVERPSGGGAEVVILLPLATSAAIAS